ncbi:hypothetical protein [Dyella tabacisoli]|uniref:Uncharacterized protein n=1 Tax=Dyella tabacisoli TaxID=2282381 RepID=A0A369UIV4_9GAMM|nr:hypothetical protein [Dyella tabacisoli]RDD80437.1 hypothetical protein DVJ77_17540 [Dyella tabacisoli]
MNAIGGATKAQLFSEMHAKGSVLNGWSVVLNLNHGYLAQRLHRQWPADAAGTRTVTLFSAQPAAPRGSGAAPARQLSTMAFVLGEPQVSLLTDRPALALSHPVCQVSGRSGQAATVPTRADDPSVTWDTDQAVNVPVQPAARVDAEVPLLVRQKAGTQAGDAPCFEVVMDVAGASVAAHHLPAAAGDGADLIGQFRQALGGTDGKLVVVSLDAATQANFPSLQPRAVALLTANTPSGHQILQVHIATGDAATPAATGIDVGDPVPVLDGADWSLMFSGQNVYQDIVVPDFNGRSGHISLAAVAPQGAGQAWYLQTQNRMQFQGTVSWGDAMPPVTQQAQIGLNFSGSPDQGLVVSTYNLPGADINLQFGIAQNYPVQCSGALGDQALSFAGSTATINGSGIAENTFKPYLQQILSTEIRTDLDAVSLAPLAAFALRTVRFPGDEAFIDGVQIPSDLVMVGILDPTSVA